MKKTNNTSGIRFIIQNQNEKNISPVLVIVNIALYLSLVWSYFSMTSESIIFSTLLGVLLIPLIQIIPKKKIRLYVSGGMTAFLLISFLIFHKYLSYSAKAVFNRVFEISQQQQNYLYSFFETNSVSATAFLVIMSLALGVTLGVSTTIRSRTIPIALLLVVAFVQGYYGISPKWYVNALLFAFIIISLALGLGDRASSLQTVIIIVLIFTAVSALTFLSMPPQHRQSNPQIYHISENIRDMFSKGTIPEKDEAPSVDTEAEANASDMGDGDEVENSDGGDNGNGGENKQSSNISVVHYNIVAIVLISALLIMIIVWAMIILITELLRKRRLKNGDNNAVAVYAFLQAFKWLCAYSLKARNATPMEYIEEVTEIMSNQFAFEFEKACDIRDIALYSKNGVDINECRQMVEFYHYTKKQIKKKAGFIKLIEIKLIRRL